MSSTIQINNNNATQQLHFLFYTTSTCVCSTCLAWQALETTPVIDREGATFGSLAVECLEKRTFSICPQWEFYGTVVYDAVPLVVTRAMMFQFDRRPSYRLDNGKVEVLFTYPKTQASPSPQKHLQIENRSESCIYVVFGTTSTCTCTTCQEWLKLETIPLADDPNWLYGVLQIDVSYRTVKPYCPQWEGIFGWFLDEMPSQVVKSSLQEYDMSKSYTMAEGKITINFSHEIEPASPVAAPSQPKHLQIENCSDRDLYVVFGTISACTCAICREWLKLETIPLADDPNWLYGVLQIDASYRSVKKYCTQWKPLLGWFLDEMPSQVVKSSLQEYDMSSSYTMAEGKITISLTHETEPAVSAAAPQLAPSSPQASDSPPKHLSIENRSESCVFMLFCSMAPMCPCTVCQEWLGLETNPIKDQDGWTYGVLQIDASYRSVKKYCTQWKPLLGWFLDEMPSQVVKSSLQEYDMSSSYTMAEGKITISLTHETEPAAPVAAPQPAAPAIPDYYSSYSAILERQRNFNTQFTTMLEERQKAMTAMLAQRSAAYSSFNPYGIYGSSLGVPTPQYQQPRVAQPTFNPQAYYAAAMAPYQQHTAIGGVSAIERANQAYETVQLVQNVVDVATGPVGQTVLGAAAGCVIS